PAAGRGSPSRGCPPAGSARRRRRRPRRVRANREGRAVRKGATYQQLRSHLAYLKLAALAEALPAALQDAEQRKPSYTDFLHDLLDVEVKATEERRLQGRLRFASFP